MVRSYIHDHLGYRLAMVATGAHARLLENQIKSGVMSGDAPLLNPATLRTPVVHAPGT